MSKRKTLDTYFKVKESNSNSQTPTKISSLNNQTFEPILHVMNIDQVQPLQSSPRSLKYERDPGKRLQLSDYPTNERDEIRKFYILEGPNQFHMDEYPSIEQGNQRRRFQYHWFKKFPWLEYSPHTNRVYCLPCFLFSTKPIGRSGSDTFTVSGFQNWRKVSCGEDCAFLSHMGKDSNSAHNFAVSCHENLKNKMCHIETVMEKQIEKEVKEARLRLKASIDSIKWLTFQACAFRGHDESSESKNQGNFLEMIKLLASYNEEVNQVVLENAPKNAKYTSQLIQKQILHIMARKVQVAIREEIGNGKFCLIVDESRDESKKEQMAIVVRFVDKEGFIRERFLDLIHVKDTTSLTLKIAIALALSDNGLNISHIRGQGYDGASNMRGEWNGLQALILKECPYAYYVHCMAHQLQLALVAASREVHEVHSFFQNVNFVINVVSASPKRHDELQAQQAEEMIHQIDLGELDTGRGANQIGTRY